MSYRETNNIEEKQREGEKERERENMKDSIK